MTAELLARGPSADGNPFINYVLPLAASDSLLMDSVLAIGGAHMAVLEPDRPQLEVMARRHYARLLEGLRKALCDDTACPFGERDEDKKLYTLLILIMLCIFEVSHLSILLSARCVRLTLCRGSKAIIREPSIIIFELAVIT